MRGSQALTDARQEYHFLRDSATRCIPTDRGIDFYTYAGGHLNLVMAQALGVALPAETQSSDISISINKSAAMAFSKIKAGLVPLDRAGLLNNVKPTPTWLDQLKFSACLPAEIAKQVFFERLDIDAWDEFKQTLTV